MDYEYEYLRDSCDTVYVNTGDNIAELHFHSNLEFLYVESGEKTVYINEKKYVLHKNNVAVIFPYDLHYFKKGGGRQTVLVIPHSYFFDYDKYFGKKQPSYPVITDENFCKKIKPLFEKLSKPIDKEYLRYAYCSSLLAESANKTGLKKVDKSNDVTLTRSILNYLEENCAEQLSLAVLAKEFGFSRTYMSMLFNKLVKTDFCSYLTYLRLKKATLLIRSGENNMATVCFKSGFNSLTAFYRAFKNKYGVSPKKFSLN